MLFLNVSYIAAASMLACNIGALGCSAFSFVHCLVSPKVRLAWRCGAE